jgi:hypothetical protein
VGLRLISPVRVVAVALLVAVALSLVVRFASGPSGAHGAPAVNGTLVRAGDFEHVDRSGPGGVVLRWWQANQFGRPLREIAGFYVAAHRPAARALRADLGVMRYVFRQTKPLVLDEYVTGDTAQVFVLIPPLGKPASNAAGVPYVFRVAREGGQWKLADDFIAQRASGERQFAAQEKKR